MKPNTNLKEQVKRIKSITDLIERINEDVKNYHPNLTPGEDGENAQTVELIRDYLTQAKGNVNEVFILLSRLEIEK